MESSKIQPEGGLNVTLTIRLLMHGKVGATKFQCGLCCHDLLSLKPLGHLFENRRTWFHFIVQEPFIIILQYPQDFNCLCKINVNMLLLSIICTLYSAQKQFYLVLAQDFQKNHLSFVILLSGSLYNNICGSLVSAALN